VEILAQSSTALVLTHNFQGTQILGASRGRLSDSVASCFLSPYTSIHKRIVVLAVFCARTNMMIMIISEVCKLSDDDELCTVITSSCR